ncbi:MAG: class I SAM-dependent methyltransferase, partial [Alphaproteobacteria bacterium]|nr:class I SAM-dependent methyltransferase [Alphaproteobacteria bacterium]
MSAPDRPQTSLAVIFERLIASHGPISVAHFMAESNARYYCGRDPLGEQGDFITAPEISQMFGELIGLWLADMWVKAGREDLVHYVELGPGHGTLAHDVLATTRRYGLEPKVHFVETSLVLRDIQLATVPQAQFHDDLSTVPSYGPVLIVGNEFLDALPVRQLVNTEQGWRERMVGLQEGRFAFVAGDKAMDSAVPEAIRQVRPGTIVETCPGAAAAVYEIAGRLLKQGGAALLIDYGHEAPRTGSTLQALRQHRMVDPLAMPGEADITAHVDFAALAPVAQSRGARWLGTVTQGRWLRQLGIEVRAERLARIAPEHRDA